MRNPLKALGQGIASLGKKTHGKVAEGLGLAPFEGDKTDLRVLDDVRTEIEPISRFPIEIGLPTITVASEEIPSGDVLPAEESFVPSTRLTTEERGRLLRLEEKVKDLIKRFQDYRQFQDSVRVDIKALNNSMEHLERVLEDMKDLRDGYSSVEKNLHELSALYDLISTQYNPFVDSAPHLTGLPRGMNGEKGLMEPLGAEFGMGTTEEIVSESHLLEWLSFLLTRIEAKQIPALLKNYEENGVISNSLRGKTLKFLRAIRPMGVKPATKNDWRLSVEDQICSIDFINKIKGTPPSASNDGREPKGNTGSPEEPQTPGNR